MFWSILLLKKLRFKPRARPQAFDCNHGSIAMRHRQNENQKKFAYFSVLLAVILFFIFLHLKGIFKPVESALAEAPRPVIYVLSGIGHSFQSFFSFFGSVAALNQTNSNLQNRVLALEQENVALQQAKLENDILRKELDYRATSKLNLVSANVIASDPSGFSQVVVIDVGSNDGIKNNDAVLSEGAFIGKILETNALTSKVLLVTDPQSTIDVQIGPTGDRGILRGSYGSGIVVDMVSQNTQLGSNDEVVTAGLTDQVPRGLYIGNIGEAQNQKTDLLQKATVISGVDLKHLIFVSVVKQ